jgi:hypothetical protein
VRPSACEIACANSFIVPNRSAGSGASAFRIARSTPSGTVPRTARTLGGGSVNRFMIIACIVGAENGGSPASISYSTEPSEYTSLRASSARSPEACSGLM